jgi:hypothetical protein
MEAGCLPPGEYFVDAGRRPMRNPQSSASAGEAVQAKVVKRPMALTSNDTISVPLDDPIRLWLYTMASTGTGDEQSRPGPVEL